MPRSKAEPRGRKSAYACFVQACRREHERRHPGGKVVFEQFSKACADKWNSMGENEKQKYFDMAERDKQRYKAECRNRKPSDGSKNGAGGRGTGRKLKLKKRGTTKAKYRCTCNDVTTKRRINNASTSTGFRLCVANNAATSVPTAGSNPEVNTRRSQAMDVSSASDSDGGSVGSDESDRRRPNRKPGASAPEREATTEGENTRQDDESQMVQEPPPDGEGDEREDGEGEGDDQEDGEEEGEREEES